LPPDIDRIDCFAASTEIRERVVVEACEQGESNAHTYVLSQFHTDTAFLRGILPVPLLDVDPRGTVKMSWIKEVPVK
jgi:hypothetical protein